MEDIAFLGNSENRVAVLEYLVDAPRSRDQLCDEIDASRAPIARVLRDLASRRWIERPGTAYAATPLGEWVCEEFTRLADDIAAERRLREPLDFFRPTR